MTLYVVIFVLTFLFTTLLGWVLHWALHQKFMGRFFKSHQAHHFKLYPAWNYTSEVYRDAGKDNAVFFFLGAFAPVFCSIFFLGWRLHLPASLIAMVLGEMIVIGILNNVIHDSFHIKNHWMNRISIFKKWNKFHHQHHKKVQTNFGIFFFLWDRVLGTFVG